MQNLVETDLGKADANVATLIGSLEEANKRMIIAHEAVQKASNRNEVTERQKYIETEAANINELTVRLDNVKQWRERVMVRKMFYFGGDRYAGYFTRMSARIEKLQVALAHPEPAAESVAAPKIRKMSRRNFFNP